MTAPVETHNRDELAWAGLVEQAALVRRRQLSPTELVTLTLERIAAIDPQLNAFRVLDSERALADARRAESRLSRPDRLQDVPLLGVPVAVKDDTDIAGHTTCFGTAAESRIQTRDAEVVRRLRVAGAIVIGKTNAPEVLIWPFTESPTWGITHNPWSPERTPGGSSGGSAAAVAAGLVAAALGSDGAGSIRIPAACCGVFGLKPQRDRISTAPHTDVDHCFQGLAAYGPLTRTVADAALFLDATADHRDDEPFLTAISRRPPRLRIAISTRSPLPGPVHPEVRAATEGIAELLVSLGHTVTERDPDYHGATGHVLARYLSGIHHSLTALEHPDRCEPRSRHMATAGRLLGGRSIKRVRAHEPRLTASANRLFDTIDVLLTPTLAAPAPRVERWSGKGALATLLGCARWSPYLALWNATGQPAASIPAGHDSHGTPLGVQLVARPYEERLLLALAAQIEHAQPWADVRPTTATSPSGR